MEMLLIVLALIKLMIMMMTPMAMTIVMAKLTRMFAGTTIILISITITINKPIGFKSLVPKEAGWMGD